MFLCQIMSNYVKECQKMPGHILLLACSCGHALTATPSPSTIDGRLERPQLPKRPVSESEKLSTSKGVPPYIYRSSVFHYTLFQQNTYNQTKSNEFSFSHFLEILHEIINTLFFQAQHSPLLLFLFLHNL